MGRKDEDSKAAKSAPEKATPNATNKQKIEENNLKDLLTESSKIVLGLIIITSLLCFSFDL